MSTAPDGGRSSDPMERVFIDAITIKDATLPEKLHLPSQAGFAGPRLRMEDLEKADGWKHDPVELARQLLQAGIRTPGLVCSPAAHEWHNDGLDDPAVVAAVDRSLSAAQALAAPVLLLPVMSNRGDLDSLERNLKGIAARASHRGVRIGLEFIGHVPKVPDLATAWQVAERCDPESVGVVIDCFHFHRGGSDLADIRRMPPERILLVDLCDAMDLPVHDLLGFRHRLMPGMGVARLDVLVNELVQHGFSGPFVIEIFNEEYWKREPARLLADVRMATTALFDRLPPLSGRPDGRHRSTA